MMVKMKLDGAVEEPGLNNRQAGRLAEKTQIKLEIFKACFRSKHSIFPFV